MRATETGMLNLELNGRTFQVEPGTTLDALFMSQYKEGFKEGIAAKLNGRVVDFQTPIKESGRLEMIPADSPESTALARRPRPSCAIARPTSASRD